MRVIETKICFPGISDSVVSEGASKSMSNRGTFSCLILGAETSLFPIVYIEVLPF